MLQFDRIMAATSNSPLNFRVGSGPIENLAGLQGRVDPVERTVVFSLGADLLPNTEYRLIVENSGRAGLQLAAFDGAPFVGRAIIRFTTGAAAGLVQADNDPEPVDPCGAVNALGGSACTGATCHGDDRRDVAVGDKRTPPAMGLSLVSYEAIEETAIGHTSVLVQLATEPGGTGETPSAFPYGLPIIDAAAKGSSGNSARSFLIYKLLMAEPVHGGDGGTPVNGSHPQLELPRPSADPFRRVADELRARVPGAPMPPSDRLDLSVVRVIRRWIDGGAPACTATGDAGVDAADAVSDGAADAVSDAASDAASDGKADAASD